MNSANAITQLEAAFVHKAGPPISENETSQLWVGCFGNGVPEVLLAAAGCRVVDVKGVPNTEQDDRHNGMARFIEPFLDDYTRLFLHRLASGRLGHLTAIVFGRQDAAALVAYQYALEYRRQSKPDHPFPELLLWNAEQGETPGVLTFNRRQAERLLTQLASLGAARPDEDALAVSIEQYRARHRVLSELAAAQRADEPRLTGLEAFRWRNAGRYLDASRFQSLLRSALSGLKERPVRPGKRLGLVGSATDAEAVYRMLDSAGALVTDLQPFGQAWPGPFTELDSLDALLESMATDPLCPRGRSSITMIEALAEACKNAGCDAVIAQMDQNDDTFGWDLPSLSQALEERGIAMIQLGFRDFRPDDSWCARVGERLSVELGELG